MFRGARLKMRENVDLIRKINGNLDIDEIKNIGVEVM